MAQGTPSGRTRVVAAGRTDVGRRRKHNEDTVLLRPALGLFIVADGMGGHNAGEVASALAARSLENYVLATQKGPLPADFAGDEGHLSHDARRLAAGARKANADVFEIASTRLQHAGMGSTLVAAMVSKADRSVHICHAGDSRCYRIRDGEIVQLTRDHSLINDALAMKPDLTPEMLAELPKNVITRAVGTQDTLDVELRSEPLVPGDLYVLCSDGLSGLVNPEQILETSELTSELDEMGDLLIIMANEAGGIDNISVVLFRVEEVDGVSRPAASAHAEVVDWADAADEDVPTRVDAEPLPVAATSLVSEDEAEGVGPDVSLRSEHEPLPPGSPEPRESGVRVVSRPGEETVDAIAAEEAELDADLATEEELAQIEAELAAEADRGEEPAFVLPPPVPPPSVPPRPAKRAAPVDVRAIISIGNPGPVESPPELIETPRHRAAVAPDGAEVLVCTVCGAEALVGSRFCVECGTRHEPETAAVVMRSDLPLPSDAHVEVTMDELGVRSELDELEPLASLEQEDEQEVEPSPPPPLLAAPAFCHDCGAPAVEDYRFCHQCGAKVR